MKLFIGVYVLGHLVGSVGPVEYQDAGRCVDDVVAARLLMAQPDHRVPLGMGVTVPGTIASLVLVQAGLSHKPVPAAEDLTLECTADQPKLEGD